MFSVAKVVTVNAMESGGTKSYPMFFRSNRNESFCSFCLDVCGLLSLVTDFPNPLWITKSSKRLNGIGQDQGMLVNQLSRGWGRQAPICCICQNLCHHGRFQAISDLKTTLQSSWKFNNQFWEPAQAWVALTASGLGRGRGELWLIPFSSVRSDLTWEGVSVSILRF